MSQLSSMASVKYFPIDNEINKALGEVEPLNFTHVYDFEKISFGLEAAFLHWSQQNWHLSIYLSMIYVALVFGVQNFMTSRPPFDLRRPLAAWSAILAIFSIMGAYRTVPDMIYILQNYSFHHSVCHPSFFYGVTGFWSITFVLSKAYELGDTAFIVLRKKNLPFLHWYHHITVMMYVWHSYSEHTAPGRWFFAMNYTVHAFMYSYYTATALQFRPPRWASMAITGMQISQMIMGCFIFVYVHWSKSTGRACQVSDANALSGSIMYLSYLVLFGNFFYNAYLRPKRSHSAGPAKQQPAGTTTTTSNDVTSVLKSVADIERRGFAVKKDN